MESPDRDLIPLPTQLRSYQFATSRRNLLDLYTNVWHCPTCNDKNPATTKLIFQQEFGQIEINENSNLYIPDENSEVSLFEEVSLAAHVISQPNVRLNTSNSIPQQDELLFFGKSVDLNVTEEKMSGTSHSKLFDYIGQGDLTMVHVNEIVEINSSPVAASYNLNYDALMISQNERHGVDGLEGSTRTINNLNDGNCDEDQLIFVEDSTVATITAIEQSQSSIQVEATYVQYDNADNRIDYVTVGSTSKNMSLHITDADCENIMISHIPTNITYIDQTALKQQSLVRQQNELCSSNNGLNAVSIENNTIGGAPSDIAMLFFALGVIFTFICIKSYQYGHNWFLQRVPRYLMQLEKQIVLLLHSAEYQSVCCVLKKQIPIVESYRGRNHVDTAAFKHFLAKALLALGEAVNAENYLRDVIAIYEPYGEDIYMAHALEDLALSLQQQQQQQQIMLATGTMQTGNGAPSSSSSIASVLDVMIRSLRIFTEEALINGNAATSDIDGSSSNNNNIHSNNSSMSNHNNTNISGEFKRKSYCSNKLRIHKKDKENKDSIISNASATVFESSSNNNSRRRRVDTTTIPSPPISRLMDTRSNNNSSGCLLNENRDTTTPLLSLTKESVGCFSNNSFIDNNKYNDYCYDYSKNNINDTNCSKSSSGSTDSGRDSNDSVEKESNNNIRRTTPPYEELILSSNNDEIIHSPVSHVNIPTTTIDGVSLPGSPVVARKLLLPLSFSYSMDTATSSSTVHSISRNNYNSSNNTVVVDEPHQLAVMTGIDKIDDDNVDNDLQQALDELENLLANNSSNSNHNPTIMGSTSYYSCRRSTDSTTDGGDGTDIDDDSSSRCGSISDSEVNDIDANKQGNCMRGDAVEDSSASQIRLSRRNSSFGTKRSSISEDKNDNDHPTTLYSSRASTGSIRALLEAPVLCYCPHVARLQRRIAVILTLMCDNGEQFNRVHDTLLTALEYLQTARRICIYLSNSSTNEDDDVIQSLDLDILHLNERIEDVLQQQRFDGHHKNYDVQCTKEGKGSPNTVTFSVI